MAIMRSYINISLVLCEPTMRLIERVWFEQHQAKFWLLPLLAPFSLVFYLITMLRRWLYRCGVFGSATLDVPVIVVGNISVGGNGKTPMVLWLIEQCQQLGLTPGVISRGYGGNATHTPLRLSALTDAQTAGDEPVMIFRRTGVPVVVGAERVASGQMLCNLGCDIIIADDGLQHYRLARDLELAVVDSKRQFGNGLLLPMGPLREALWRLNTVDFVIANGDVHSPFNSPKSPLLIMQLTVKALINCVTGECQTLAWFLQNHPTVNAMAGIGAPSRFFSMLEQLNFSLQQTHAFVDHHAFQAEDLAQFSNQIPLLMTEKDAVKCQTIATQHCWYVAVDAEFTESDSQQMMNKINHITQLTTAKLSKH